MPVSYGRYQHFGPQLQARYRRRYGQPSPTAHIPEQQIGQGGQGVFHPTHTDSPSPLAVGGGAQTAVSAADRAARRPLLDALALMRARQGLGGAGTERRLGEIGQGTSIQGAQALSDPQFQFLLHALTRGRGRRAARAVSASPRYGGLRRFF